MPHTWEYYHGEIGYNYRLPTLKAVLDCAQLKQLSTMLVTKRELFARYQSAFAAVQGIKLVAEPARCQSNYGLQMLLLDVNHADQRNAVLKATYDADFMTRPAWILMHEQACFKNCPRMDLAMSQSLVQWLIIIPSSSCLVPDVL